MLRKLLFTAVLCASASFCCTAGAENGISVQIDGERVVFEDIQPMIIEGRTLVPLRGVFENLGTIVGWDDETKTASVSYKVSKEITVTLGSDTIAVSGAEDKLITIDVPAQIVNDRMMIPLRAVSEALDCGVEWDGDTRTVSISRVHDGVSDGVRIENVKLENGKTVDIIILDSTFKSDGAVETQLNTLISGFVENLLSNHGADILPTEAYSGDENYIMYSTEAFYDRDGNICLIEYLGAGDSDSGEAYIYDGAVFNAESGELIEETDFLQTDEEE